MTKEIPGMRFNWDTWTYDATREIGKIRVLVSFKLEAVEDQGLAKCWERAEQKIQQCGDNLPPRILVTEFEFIPPLPTNAYSGLLVG
jgi:hypothetical protein